MGRGRAEDHVGQYKINFAALHLLRRVFLDHDIKGWADIRSYLGSLGVCPPRGPSVSTMRKWRQRPGGFFPVQGGVGRRPPFTTAFLLTAWAFENISWWMTRGRRQ